MDDLTPEQRHKNMSRIKSVDTKPEITLRKALWKKGIRYRKNYKELPGKPDIVLTKYNIAIFCDGEFFHGKDWEKDLCHRLKRSNNSEYWIKKILNNIERDRKNNMELRKLGWTVIRFWSREVLKETESCVQKVERVIRDIK